MLIKETINKIFLNNKNYKIKSIITEEENVHENRLIKIM